jgi:hypothetical protein
MSLIEHQQKHRRRVILESLNQATGFSLNESLLKTVLSQLGHQVGKDDVRADVTWLEQQGLLRTETIPMPRGELWVAHLLDAGATVADGRPHPGVARAEPA